MASQTADDRGLGFGFFRRECIHPHWVILVGDYGAFLFTGTEAQAEDMRVHKSRWEGAVGHKRCASVGDFDRPSHCWNHRGFAGTRAPVKWGSRGRPLKRVYSALYWCDCGGCPRG